MAISSIQFSHLTVPLLSVPSRIAVSRTRISCSSSASTSMDSVALRNKFIEFPYVSAPHRSLMLELISLMEIRLGDSLEPCTLPPDVQYFENPNGNAHASLHLRSGVSSSQIDVLLGGWIHCKLPSGGDLNITSLSSYLKSSTDAPHFLMELIQSSSTSLVLILDLTPRKDLILNPDYLKTYYEDTQLDSYRQRLHTLPEVKPYCSPSFYIRAVLSPTAILVSIDTGGGERSIEEIIQEHISPVAKDIVEFWLDNCACVEKQVGESERACLAKRDGIMKNKTIEVDLCSSFPRLFGQEVAARVLCVLMEYYNA